MLFDRFMNFAVSRTLINEYSLSLITELYSHPTHSLQFIRLLRRTERRTWALEWNAVYRMASRALTLLADADGAGEWRMAYNRQLGNLIQKRLFYLQVWASFPLQVKPEPEPANAHCVLVK